MRIRGPEKQNLCRSCKTKMMRIRDPEEKNLCGSGTLKNEIYADPGPCKTKFMRIRDPVRRNLCGSEFLFFSVLFYFPFPPLKSST